MPMPSSSPTTSAISAVVFFFGELGEPGVEAVLTTWALPVWTDCSSSSF